MGSKMDWGAVKRTKQREFVLDLLSKSNKPMTAGAIFADALDKKQSNICLSTVYRILDTFVRSGVVVKTAVIDGEAVYEIKSGTHKHYAVCSECHKLIAIDACPIETFAPALNSKGFKITGHSIEIYGICKDCLAV